MIVIADKKKRITLPTKAGERFDVQAIGGDKFILTQLAPVAVRPVAVKIQKKDGFSVGKLGRAVNVAALQQALAKFS